MDAFRPESILDDETEALKRLNETLSNENCQLKDKINDLEAVRDSLFLLLSCARNDLFIDIQFARIETQARDQELE